MIPCVTLQFFSPTSSFHNFFFLQSSVVQLSVMIGYFACSCPYTNKQYIMHLIMYCVSS